LSVWVRSGEQTKETNCSSAKAKELGVDVITQSPVMRNVTDGAWLWILAKAVHRAKRQSHFIRLRDQRILRNRMRILLKKFKPLG